MGTKTRNGYPIPEDKNPHGLPEDLIFPWDQAATLVTVAEKVGNTAVRAQVDLIRKMLGNPGAVSTVLGAWQTAQSELTQSIDGSNDGTGLQTAKENLGARWNGSAREAAVSYVDRLITATHGEQKSIGEIATSINNFSAFVSNNYGTAIAHISNYAAIVADLAGGLIEEIREAIGMDGGSVETKIIQALAEFMRETGEVLKDVRTYRTQIEGEVDQIKIRAAEVTVPPAIAPAALDTNGWQPRNPTGTGWGRPS
ncbi:hypothetical protein [Nocardia cyriacigeorgica]|uniref:hypothetical protein n=1 Tax=Nocardia cyriacigeorgica TaxID=135487 RepID=UPI002492522E|nr:hypothetical protein [Nocardia cyriacigeorgica]BDU07121.1 hypothetical protein FMUBM48_33840 [Nocardia cyriacigeorgica]